MAISEKSATAMEVATVTYVWYISEGELSLLNSEDGYQFQLTTKDKTIDIAKENIEGFPSPNSVSKIEEVTENYFPTLTLDKDVYSLKLNQTEKEYSLGNPKSFNFEFNKLDNVKFLNFDKKAPDYRRVGQGLNFRGICISSKLCPAFNKVIYIPKGFGTSNIPKESAIAVCPKCKKTAGKVDNLGFFSCKYVIEGMQTKPKEKKVNIEGVAPDDKYQTFHEDKATWSYLEVTTSPKDVKASSDKV